MQTWKITEINPHEGPHLDEVIAAVFARRYGKESFGEGIATAVVVPQKLEDTEDEWLNKGHLPLGQLRGLFDDKDSQGVRIKDTCCALRMAHFLKIERTPELDKLFRAVNRVDGNASARSTDLSTLIKEGNSTVAKEHQPLVFAWAETGVNAIINYLLNPVECTDYVRASVVFEEMVKKNEVRDREVIARFRRTLMASEKQIESCIELMYILRAMKAMGVSDEYATAWLKTGLSWSIKQQEQYQLALGEIKEVMMHPIKPRQKDEWLYFVLVKSDNPQIAKASASEKYAVCIVRRSSGNVAIIPNGDYNLDMEIVRALIRIMETSPEKRQGAKLSEYSETGTHPNVPHWYVMDGPILNGTNYISAEPTKLTDEELIQIVRIGFCPEGRQKFVELGGVVDRGPKYALIHSADAFPHKIAPEVDEALREETRRAFDNLERAFL